MCLLWLRGAGGVILDQTNDGTAVMQQEHQPGCKHRDRTLNRRLNTDAEMAYLRRRMEIQGFSRLLTASLATTRTLYSSSTSSSPRTCSKQGQKVQCWLARHR